MFLKTTIHLLLEELALFVQWVVVIHDIQNSK
jgi:hypothetical protein